MDTTIDTISYHYFYGHFRYGHHLPLDPDAEFLRPHGSTLLLGSHGIHGDPAIATAGAVRGEPSNETRRWVGLVWDRDENELAYFGYKWDDIIMVIPITGMNINGLPASKCSHRSCNVGLGVGKCLCPPIFRGYFQGLCEKTGVCKITFTRRAYHRLPRKLSPDDDPQTYRWWNMARGFYSNGCFSGEKHPEMILSGYL